MKTLTIVSAQLNLIVGDIEGNTTRIIESAKEACQTHGADLVLFPELSITSYPPEDLLFRSALYHRVYDALEKICKESLNTTLIVGYPDLIDGKHYNKAAIISDGKIITTYAKKELPNYRVFDEKRYFSRGKETCIINIKNTKIGVLICEDLWKPNPIKDVVTAGAQLVVSINASPFAQDKSHHRRDLLQQQTTANNIPIVYVNLVGGQDELVFDGGSMTVNREGKVVQQGKYLVEDLMVSRFNLDTLELISPEPLPPEPIDEAKVYNTLVLGVRDYIKKNNFPSALVGLSGGIDSALTLAIAVDAIGADNVRAIIMPSQYNSPMSSEDAQLQAKLLRVKTTTIAIEPIYQSFMTALATEFKNYDQNITEENLQSRIRGTLLMAISNKKNAIVLTTGNKSEMAVGYATLYGDMAGGFGVLKDVYKTMVYRLARYRNTLNPIIPERVLKRPPSAELAPNQKD